MSAAMNIPADQVGHARAAASLFRATLTLAEIVTTPAA
jgi:hypothetical protein